MMTTQVTATAMGRSLISMVGKSYLGKSETAGGLSA